MYVKNKASIYKCEKAGFKMILFGIYHETEKNHYYLAFK